MAQPQATELFQERRLVTVLFADIVGFTALAEALDPEELQELMSDIFRSLIAEAERNDGTIEKFIGDAIFVIFGAPVAHEDDPDRALRTALAMQRAFAQHAGVVRSRYGRDLALRIGVHTGIVIAGQVRAATEYGVMGDTVNVAMRLQENAQPGEILVTQATFRLTNPRFSFREVGPITVKGKEQPILVYALTGERETAGPSIELSTPLVGRWMELSRLDLAYQSAVDGRTARHRQEPSRERIPGPSRRPRGGAARSAARAPLDVQRRRRSLVRRIRGDAPRIPRVRT